MSLIIKTLRNPLALALLAVPLLSPLSISQTPGAPRLAPKIYLGAGYAAILNPDGIDSLFNPSISFQIGVGLPISPGFEILGRFHYHDFSAEKISVPLSDANLRIWTIGLDAKWPLAPPFSPAKPYALIGLGRFKFKENDPTGLNIRDETGLYFNVGGGIDVKLGPSFAFFAEAKYTIVSTSNESTGIAPLLVGIRIL